MSPKTELKKVIKTWLRWRDLNSTMLSKTSCAKSASTSAESSFTLHVVKDAERLRGRLQWFETFPVGDWHSRPCEIWVSLLQLAVGVRSWPQQNQKTSGFSGAGSSATRIRAISLAHGSFSQMVHVKESEKIGIRFAHCKAMMLPLLRQKGKNCLMTIRQFPCQSLGSLMCQHPNWKRQVFVNFEKLSFWQESVNTSFWSGVRLVFCLICRIFKWKVLK